MRRMFVLAAASLFLLGGCRAQKAPQAPERVLDTTTFPHSTHVDAGLGCSTCHEEAPKWQKLGEYKVPPVAKCEECHDRSAPADAKKFSPPAREPRPAYAINFSHANHIPRVGAKDPDAACATCHKVLPQPGEQRRTTPPMDSCTACHNHQQDVAEARCRPCHVSLKRFPMKPIQQFTEFSHGVNFVREHGRLAKNSAETCAQCHDQTYCANCHATATLPLRPEVKFPENVTSDFIHRGDYTSRHEYDVSRDPASCRKCHGSRFCESCHETQNLSPRAGFAARNPHPDWQTQWRVEHGRQARRDIVRCAGCHDQSGPSNTCVGCHQRGGIAELSGKKTHPPGWTSKHDAGDIAKNAACRACHNQ